MNISAHAHRDVVIAESVVYNYGPDAAQFDQLLRAFDKIALNSAGVLPHERYFSDQLDRLRDGAKDQDPETNLRLFQAVLGSLPPDASPTTRYRAKANIGLQYLSLGNAVEAARWLIEAYDEAPDDPRAVANRALAYWLNGDAEEAYRFGRERLALDTTNETLASYLPQIAVTVQGVTDGLDGIPEVLHEKEAVAIGQAVFLRGRNRSPLWWEWARSALKRFPESNPLKLLVAFSEIDEITHDEQAQRTQLFDVDQRARLASAAAVLDASWRARRWSLTSNYDDAAQALVNAMIAYRMLHDRDAALDRAERIAKASITDPNSLLNGVIVALSFGQDQLARSLISLAPDDPNLAFHAGVLAIQDDDWGAAAELFARAEVPESEKRVAETVVALAPIKMIGRPADASAVDAAPLKALINATLDSPRGLILIAQVARMLGLEELSGKTLAAAVNAVPEDCHLSTRLMVADQADRAGAAAMVIQILDGHLPVVGFEREYEKLAVAHANERPHRQRNLAFFQNLPATLRQQHGIARAYASVLLDLGHLTDAVKLFRRLHLADQTDALVTLQLVYALQRSTDAAGASAVLRSIDLSHAIGAPEHIMALAQLVMREGEPQKAYPVAYDTVRQNPDNARIVLGYAGMGLLLQEPNPMFATPVAGAGSSVSIQGPDGTRQSFIIDDKGNDFFGISVLRPGSGMAARVAGLVRGQTFELAKMGADPEVWTVVDVSTKYLHLHHRILEEFETRFPDKPGLARFTVGEDNVDAVFKMVRRSSEQNAINARAYMEETIPLSIVARGLGGNAVNFAQYILQLGGQIVTCVGSLEERTRGLKWARRYRGQGAVLDPYTAWVAAEIGILPDLKAFFGDLCTPASTIAMIDRMIDRENDGRGRAQITLSFHDGQFYRTEVTDEFRDSQIAALTRVRSCVVADCNIVSVLIPDNISESAELMIKAGGSRFLDAAYLAKETDAILLSDDMRYRDFSDLAVACNGVWLQVVLQAAAEAGQLLAVDYARAIVGLAHHGHNHIALTGQILYLITRQDQEDLRGLKTVLKFLAGPNAEPQSHLVVFCEYLDRLWTTRDKKMSRLRVLTATSLGLDALLASPVWQSLLANLIWWSRGNREIYEHVHVWRKGHFITDGLLENPPEEESSRRRRKSKRA